MHFQSGLRARELIPRTCLLDIRLEWWKDLRSVFVRSSLVQPLLARSSCSHTRVKVGQRMDGSGKTTSLLHSAPLQKGR